MRQIKLTTALLLIVALSYVSLGFACSKSEKDRNIAFARDVAASLRAAAPIIARKAPQLSGRLTAAIDKADQLVNAIAASDQMTIQGLLRDILPVVTDVVNRLPGDNDIQVALALGQIALNFFVNHFLAQTSEARAPVKRGTMTASGDSDVIRDFKALPQFGCRLHPDRCR